MTDSVRKFAEDLCERLTGNRGPGTVLHVEDHLRSFLEEREKGRGQSRVTVDDGYAWLRANNRMNEKKLWDAIGRWAEGSREVSNQQVPQIEGIVESAFVAGAALAHDENAERDSALTAALAEAAGLRGHLQAMVGLIRDITERPLPPGPKKVFKILLPAESALDSPSPLSRAAAEVLEAAEETRDLGGMTSELVAAVDHLRVLRRGEGEEGCPCGLPGGQHKLQCPNNQDRQATVPAREEAPDEA